MTILFYDGNNQRYINFLSCIFQYRFHRRCITATLMTIMRRVFYDFVRGLTILRMCPLCFFWPPIDLSGFSRRDLVRLIASFFIFSLLGGILLLLLSFGGYSYLDRRLRSIAFSFLSIFISLDWASTLRFSLHISACW